MSHPLRPASQNRWSTWGPIAALVLVNLIVGFTLVPHYGPSLDEEANILFARGSIDSYRHPADPYLDPSREDKGPFYLMVWLRAGEALDRLVDGWAFVDGRHFTNWAVFQLAVISVYVLALRFVSPVSALAATLLFETQPVLFGHGFINQKDTPFMAFFALAVAVGLSASDTFVRRASQLAAARSLGRSDAESFSQAAVAAWRADRRRARRALLVAVVVALIVPIASLVLIEPVRAATDHVVRAAYEGSAWGPVNELFRRIAENAGQVDPAAYVRRAERLLGLAVMFLSGLMVIGAVVIAAVVWPEGRRRMWPPFVRELRDGLRVPPPASLFLGGVILGMAIAVRSAAIYAAILVIGYGMARAGPRILIAWMVYLAVAGVTAVLLWPQLWAGPALLAASLARTIVFPEQHRTLFEGLVLFSQEMPRTFLPVVMAIQLTLPALVVLPLGLAVALRRLMRHRLPGGVFWVLLLWIAGPVIAVVAFRVPIYNYFRHVLFIMPPLFVFGACAIDFLLRLVRRPALGVGLVAILLLPGLAGVARLHPYEYGYFNELVGGVRGAYGRFMSDYWCTAYREAMAYVNEIAPPAADIAVSSAVSTARASARPDLQVRDVHDMETDPAFEPIVVVACNFATIDPDFFRDAPLLFQVERDGVPLALVKLLGPRQSLTSP